MHAAIYENQDRLGRPLFLGLAERLQLSAPDLEQALAEGRFKSKIEQDFLGGVRSGVNRTPSFFINGRRHDSDYGYVRLRDAIDNMMRARRR